jgi:hypothetical protein
MAMNQAAMAFGLSDLRNYARMTSENASLGSGALPKSVETSLDAADTSVRATVSPELKPLKELCSCR